MSTVKRLEDDWEAAVGKVRRMTARGHPAAPQPTFTPRQPATASQQSQQSQPEVPRMSIGTEIHRIAAVLETFGEDGIAIFEAIAANPETRAAVIALANVAGLPLTGGTITAAIGGLGMIENVWHVAQQAAAAAQQQAQQAAQQPAAGQPKVIV